MSTPQNSFQPTGFSSFDHPSFDEDVLFDDFGLSQEPFTPKNPDDLETQELNRDELFEDVHELEKKRLAPSGRSEDRREPHHGGPQEAPEALKSLRVLDILLHPPTDINNAVQRPKDSGTVQLDNQFLPDGVASLVNATSSMVLEEPFIPTSGLPKLDIFDSSQEVQKGTGISSHQESQLFLPASAAAIQNEEMTDVHVNNANMDLAHLDSMMEGKLHHTQFEGGRVQPTRKRPLDIFEESFTAGMFPDIFNPSSDEGNPAHLDACDMNTPQMPPPKRQRKVGLPSTVFSQPPHHSGNRQFLNFGSPNQDQESVVGSERPKKRSRTRIEDMDPSMVHVCNFPGCTKKFAKKYNLKIHQRRHNGDLPFLCEYAGCAKRFMWLSSFSRHLRVHEARRNGGRRRREVLVESPEQQNNDASLEREPDIAISENFSIFCISGVKLFVENELSEDVTLACALTALDSKPCENLIPVAQIAQAKRRQLLATGRSEEFYQQQTMRYDMNNAHLQNLCQLLAVNITSDQDAMIDESNPPFE